MTVLTEPLPRVAVSRLRLLKWNPRLVAGVMMLTAFVVLAVINPLLLGTVWSGERGVYHPVNGYDPSIAHPSTPSLAHWLGTDPLGRDVLSLVTASLWPSLLMATVVAITTGVVSLIAAAVAAFYRRTTDRVLTSVADATLLFPAPLMFLVVAIARPDIPVVALGLVYGLVYGLGAGAIVVRSRALVIMAKPFIEAARVAGGSPSWIISRHLVPHLLPYVAVQVLAAVTGALIVQGFIEYNAGGTRVGLGNLVYQAITYHEALITPPPWSALLAGGLTLSLLAATFYLMSSGLQEMLEPTPVIDS
jgi:peptide/nickel transport system permease protein